METLLYLGAAVLAIALAGLIVALRFVQKEAAQLRGEKTDLEQRLATSSQTANLESSGLRSSLAVLQETLEQERKQAAAKVEVLTEARAQMTQEFKILANEVLQGHGETFTKQNKEQMDLILGPLRAKLGEFQLGLQSAHTESVTGQALLKKQIEQLSQDSEKLTLEASSLSRALRGESQKQGAWGEMILESILERSGLAKGQEYVTQQSHTTEDGQRVRPDVLVRLPGGQQVVIDSKVSLTAFDSFVNAATEVESEAALTRHVASIRTHIKALSSKEYHAAVDSPLDFVVMFVPIEGALAAALRREPDLTAFAVDKGVGIATPATLLMALRTVKGVWQVERRNQNAEEIAASAGKVYDKLVGFMEDMKSIGNRLDQARDEHSQAMNKLSLGRGNLLDQVEKLKGMGAKTSKSLPGNLADASDVDEVGQEPAQAALFAEPF